MQFCCFFFGEELFVFEMFWMFEWCEGLYGLEFFEIGLFIGCLWKCLVGVGVCFVQSWRLCCCCGWCKIFK